MITSLTSAEAAERLLEHGPNEVAREKAASPWLLALGQFKSPVIWLLLGACAISAVLGDAADAIAIGAIVAINAAVGFFQEFRAVVVSVILQLALHHIPATQALFQIGAIPLSDCALALALGLIPVSVLEVSKLLRRLKGPRPATRA
jgi:hypothetical protein